MVTFNIFNNLDKFQFGLFQWYFTETALFKLSSDLLKQENTGECSVLVILYPGAAFIVYCLTSSGIDYSCVYFLTAWNSLLTGLGKTSNNQLLDAQNAAAKLPWLPITLENRTKGDCRSSSCVLELLFLRTMTPLTNSMWSVLVSYRWVQTIQNPPLHWYICIPYVTYMYLINSIQNIAFSSL